MKETKKYWKGLEELNEEKEFLQNRDQEFPEYLPLNESRPSDASKSEDSSRRDFLKLMGFSVAAVSLAACETPLKKVIPYVKKPVNVDPGKAAYYATTYYDGNNFANVLVKTREGRPVHIEGNSLSTVNGKGTNAQISASLLNLYDSSRLQSFTKAGAKIDQAKADKEIKDALGASSNIRIVSQSVVSPSTKAVISEFKEAYSSAKHVQYDPLSLSGLRKANGGVVPAYKFDKADTIVSIGADFLSTWLSPVEFASQYAKNRKLSKTKDSMSLHFQFEAVMSLTGSNADHRAPILPSEEASYVVALYNLIASATGATTYKTSAKANPLLAKAAKALLASKGKSLVVSGSNDVHVQSFVAQINELLGNVGSTLDLEKSCNLKQGDDTALVQLLADVKAGNVDAIIFYGANPVYDSVIGSELAKALKKVKTKISFADRVDETSSLVDYICPDLNVYESWGDAEAYKGSYSLIQPTITPIFKQLRAAQESLLVWAGSSVSYYDYLRSFWKENIFSGQSSDIIFDSFWDKTLQNGVLEANPVTVVSEEVEEDIIESIDLSSSATAIAKSYKAGGIELSLYANASMGTGSQANNVWLQELPDPISKVCWDNYLAVSQEYATKQNLKQGDVVKVVAGSVNVTLPILIQPGQAKGAVSIALGYGRTQAGVITERLETKKSDLFIKNPAGINAAGEKAIGVNVYPFASVINGSASFQAASVTITKTGAEHKLAQTQTHQTIMGRNNVQEATLSEYKEKKDAGRFYPVVHTSKGTQKPNEVDLWAAPASNSKAEYEDNKKNGVSEEIKTHKYPNHHWGLVIDLNSCIGCSACSISCHSENNVPVVGKDEVLRKRDMHWMRIDRYYASRPEQAEYDKGTDRLNAKANAKKGGYADMEDPADNPEVVFQPMMCQHCNHAPCETVCPVAATTHSSEGLNQMAYNRCIGTRYCANNCPYKVRRFNWFNYSDNGVTDREFGAVNYTQNDDLGKMVLNPDVTVRARGTMEKCSMCVQRIQAGKLEAKVEGRKVKDGDIVTACASVCPTDAIVFGDMNDENSMISKVMNEENKDRNFQVLEELNVKPNISYLTKIRNKA